MTKERLPSELQQIIEETIETLPNQLCPSEISMLTLAISASYMEPEDLPEFFRIVSRMAASANAAHDKETMH